MYWKVIIHFPGISFPLIRTVFAKDYTDACYRGLERSKRFLYATIRAVPVNAHTPR